jgi:hypothetical protein
MKRCLTFVLIFAWLWSNASIAEDSTKSRQWKKRAWYSPHYFPLQYAGNIGFLSAGVGYGARKDNYQLSLVYGYAPPSVAGVRIHTVTAKNIFHLYRFYLSEKRTLIPYAGLGLSFEIGGRSFLTLPSNMPEGYYDFPKSVHLIASGGIKLRYVTNNSKAFRGFEFFAEACTVDAYVWYKFLSDEVKMRHIMSVAVGVHLLRK